MRKLFVVLPTLVVLAGGCDSGRRDFTYCDSTYTSCKFGYTCNYTIGLCVPETDASIADTNLADSTPAVDTSPVEASEGDTKDAPIVTDGTPFDTSGVDTSIIDAPVVDVASPDTRIPDAAGTCAVDNDCVGVAAGAYCVNNRCVACRTDSQCNNAAGKPFCSAQNTCVSCAAVSGPDGGSACPANAPVCASSGSCVECVGNSDCPTAGKAFCVQNKCGGCDVPGATAGGTSAGATDAGPRDGGSTSTGPCSGGTPVCVPSNSTTAAAVAGQCVGCASNSDCSGSTPICTTTATAAIAAYTCTACTSDTQCTSGPGVCMFHQDGRCASDAETIYVRNSASCSGGAGTSASPYCDSQTAISAITASKRVIVMNGPNLYPVTSTSTSSTGKITIVGQNTATTAAGAFVGIHVTAGDVYVRGLTVAGGNNAGIMVDAGATLRMDRCIVKGNVGGGLIVMSGASFDIANSVFDNNGPGLVGTTTTFGGVYLGGSAPSAGPHQFWFNTVVNNQDRGVICFDTTQVLTGMLLYANTNGDYLSCALDATSKWSSGSPTPSTGSSDITNPALTSTYHLTSTSKCKDFINPTVSHPSDDIDGDIRPKGTKLDCGADEF